jgi:hypothetical protein
VASVIPQFWRASIQACVRSVLIKIMGASVIKCCYAARNIPGSWRVTEVAGYTNTTATWSDIKKTILDEKISLNVSGLLVNPACIAGVLT